MDSLNDFDIGPLTWVKGEIDVACNAAAAALTSWNGEDLIPLKEAVTYLHQVSGALQIVGLQGVYQVNSAIEALLAEMQAKAALRHRGAADQAIQAIRALQAYLDGLMAGGVNAELALMPAYTAIQVGRGAEPPPPSELFFPDVGLRVRRPAPEPQLDATGLARALRTARSKYQKGLLQYLQNKDAQSGLAHMEVAVREVEPLAPGAAQYTFWWTVGGMLEAMRRHGSAPDPWTKRLFSRLDLQLRKLTEGSRQLAESLFRDVLYGLLHDTEPAGRAAEVRALFELDRYLPPVAGGPDEQRALDLRPMLARLREGLAAAKEQWLQLCSGRKESLGPLRSSAKQILEAAGQIGDAAIDGLAKAIQQAVADTADADEAVRNEALQVEMATALLLLQHGAEDYFKLGHDFGSHAELQAGRLRAAVSGEEPLSAVPGAPLLDEIARQAQEKLLLTQVSREIQANLNQIEEILDKFFRNRTERAGLPLVPGLLKQVQGALNMLQLEVASELVQAVSARVGQIASADHALAAEELNWIAEAISSLGLYVEALRNGRDDPAGLQALLTPAEVAGPAEASLETTLAEAAEKLLATAGQLNEAADQTELRGEIRSELARIAQDADLVGDSSLHGQAGEALRLLDENAAPDAIRTAVRSLTGAAAATDAETPAALAQSEQEVDAELLEIYLEEANSVLGDIAGRLLRLRESSHEHADFVDIRRGFHTLKGSGRMVGLNDLAEVAWEAEQTLNFWLREERAINGAILDFVDLAAAGFRRWVAELAGTGTVRHLDAEAVVARARHLRGEPEAVEAVVEAPVAEAIASGAAQEVPLEPARTETPVEPVIEPEPVLIGDHAVPAPLFAVFSAEAAQRLAELRQNLADLAEVADEQQWAGFARAAHTLAGIARTTGLTPLATAAHEVETWASAWPDKARPLPEAAHATVCWAVERLAAGLEDIARHDWPSFPDDLAARLAELAPETEPSVELLPTAEAVAVAEPVPEAGAAAEELYAALVAEAPAATPAVELPAEACDPQLLPIFLAEADELLPRIGDSLRRWRATPAEAEPCQALQRALHTLKGSARMAGAMRLGDATHAMETRIAERGETPPDAAFLDSLEHDYDALAEQVDRLRQPVQATPLRAEAGLAETGVALPMAPLPEDDAGIRQAFRAKANILDTLINEAGEVSIARSRIEVALNHYRLTAQELTANVERLRGQLRELEIEAETQIGARMTRLDDHFDPLEFDRYTRLQELTRLMAESVNDVSTAQENLLAGLSDAEYALLQQGRTTRSLQQELMHIRMVRLNSQAERLHRIVRQAARELGRNAHLQIEGGDTELDRSVLDKAMVPFEHLLRNAVAHGIETAERRRAADKPEYGDIRLSARQEGAEVVLTLSDDGAGVDLDKVHARAEAMDWLRPGEPAERERLESFLFMPGFSTMETVTQVAGRGVGLDVVRSEIASVGGRIRIESEPGRGTRFTIRLPTTLALAQVVLAKAGNQVYAIPAGMVVLVREVQEAEWHGIVADGRIDLDEQAYPLRSLAELTGQQPLPVVGRYRTVLLLRSGDERVAMRVDGLSGNTEAVVKAIGPQLSRVPGVAGATVLPDGRVSLILNPFALMESAPAEAAPVVEAADADAGLPLVLVVDDSLTVRKITGRLLHREGYRVTTAKDGVEALEVLQDEVPAVMLLDIEMPRMDGFEVARHVRADPRTHDLPIIMITSRTADKHRDHATELGVDLYMGKPYQEEELVAAIAGFMAR
ncbi:MAG: Hpt domain-containing protein [Gallionellaceae bacterium]|nr:Hpt domain-containing protein [Gallionellaceae bacterium]